MADHSDIRFQAGQAAGQAEEKKDDLMNKAAQSASEAKEKVGGYIQETGEQMKCMAQDAADSVKKATGMDNKSA